jgi:hypothetical protein
VRSVISGGGELSIAPRTAASMLDGDKVRAGAGLGTLGARAFAIDGMLGAARWQGGLGKQARR